MSVDFPASPSDGQKLSAGDALHVYKSSKGYWKSTPTTSGIQLASLGVTAPADASGSGGVSYNNTTGDFTYTPPVLSAGFGATVYATAADLPLSGNTAGDQAYVTATNRLYLWTGTGWHNIALVNTSPTITTGGAATYNLATDGTATVITLAATDPEEVPITWSHSVTAGSLGSSATVSQSGNVFTITPSTDSANAGEFSLTFTASDGVNIATSTSAFTLSFIRTNDYSGISSSSAFGVGATSMSTSTSTSSLGGTNKSWQQIAGNSTHTIASYTDDNDSDAPWIVVSTVDGTLVKNWRFDGSGTPAAGGHRLVIRSGEGWFTIYREGTGIKLYDLSNISNSTHGLVDTFTTAGLVAGWKYGTKFIGAWRNPSYSVQNRDVEKFIVYDMSNSMSVLHTYNTSSESSYCRQATMHGDKFYMPMQNDKLVVMDLGDYSTTTHNFSGIGEQPYSATDGVHYIAAGDPDLGQAGAIRIYSLSSSSLLRTISNAAYRWRKSGNNLFQEGKQFKITEDGAYIVGVVKVTSASATANRNKLSVWRISDGAWMGSVDSQTNGNSDTEWAYGGGVVTALPDTGLGLHVFTFPED